MDTLQIGDVVISGNALALVKVLASVILAAPIAWHRERHSRIVGLRTFPLVALGACGYLLVGQAMVGTSEPDALARILQGLITGIGFIGGGAIFKGDDYVAGTASAASIWITGALGAAVAMGLWFYAVLLASCNFLVVIAMTRAKDEVETQKDEIADNEDK